MPNGFPDNSQEVSAEGQSIILNFERTSPTTGTLSWTVPTPVRAYNGILITGAIREINPSNYPTDSVRYTGSSDFSVIADRIGNAQVIGAFYNDRVTNSLAITGLDPDLVYFFSAHLITNVNTYWAQGVRSYPQKQTTTAYSDSLPSSYGPPDNPAVGEVYYDENQKLVFFWSGTDWQTTSANNAVAGRFDPQPPFDSVNPNNPDWPQLGDFFYNTQEKMLKSWNGNGWIPTMNKAGAPMYTKAGIGTDQTYTARAKLIDVLKKQLGHPVVCVELTEDHFNIAVDNALEEIRRRTDTAYYKEYFFLGSVPNQSLYYLNDPAYGTDRIVDVVKVHRLNMMGITNFSPDNILVQQFLQQFYAPHIGADLVSIHLISAMGETYNHIFAGEISFNWRESTRQLQMYRKLGTGEKVLIESTCEKFEQELLQDRWMQQWIQQWAEAELMVMLGHIRGKYATLPGPGGGLQLNADSLIMQAQQLHEDCLRQIRDMEVGQNGPDNWYSPIVIG